jgi:cytochrome c-type biogenesis protein CcmH/NrfF
MSRTAIAGARPEHRSTAGTDRADRAEHAQPHGRPAGPYPRGRAGSRGLVGTLIACLVGLLLAAPLAAMAEPTASVPADDFAAFEDAALEARYRGLISKLRCLVCQNESLADSHASLAADLRREVRGMLEAGQGDDEILAFLTERYGDFVLYDPPLDARTLVLWAGPPLLLMFAAGWLGLTLARRARTTGHDRPLDADTRAAVARALDEET